MGVTIHYRGKLDDSGRVGDLQRELADIAESIGWKWRVLEDDVTRISLLSCPS